MTEEQGTRVTIGIHWPLVRLGVAVVLRQAGMTIVAETGSENDLVQIVGQHHPEVAVISWGLHHEGHGAAIGSIRKIAPNTRIMVICEEGRSVATLRRCLVETIAAGAHGCLPIDVSQEQLVLAIRAIQEGTAAVSARVLRSVVEGVAGFTSDGEANSPFSVQEHDVLVLASRGMSNKAIAEHLSQSERAVNGHLHTIFRKLEASSRTEAIYKALVNQWISLPTE